jgi:D-alanyl-lipoteichoic acid acyltransferase DltB (MBOAT superfamily)
MTFNDFVWQVSTPPLLPVHSDRPLIARNGTLDQIKNPIPPNRRTLISYALRFLSCLLTMEVVLHFMYVVAIKDTGAWQGDTPAELSMVGFWNLIIVWLKVRVVVLL